jgi:NAD(P)-dependent dehydrogenase (short-subunit alcohol dehydrogenase family)
MISSPQSRVVFILSISSDIGSELARRYLAQGAIVCGTYRNTLPADLGDNPRFKSLRCDANEPDSHGAIASFLKTAGLQWDIFISCVGQLSPIGLFFENDFEQWSEAVNVNSTSQLRALHAAYPFRRSGDRCHVVFFAGGGTNNPFRAYSAYCIGKIALIKMCELLDDEAPDLNAFIVGTGWVRTKIHEQTINAGPRAGVNHATTSGFLASDVKGTSHDDIAAMIEWGIAQDRPVAGGRNFSVVHDHWRDGGHELSAQLRANPHQFKLRRSGNL